MLDENRTEASREGALNAYESLFGDTVAEAAAAPAEEQDANKETDQEPRGSDDATGEAAGDETAAPNELKVVVSVKDGRATIGVQQPSSDPHIESFDDPDLSELSQEVSAVIERARAKWEEAPKYPAHERPAPPAKRRTRREQRSAQASTAVEGESDQQQPEALRLF